MTAPGRTVDQHVKARHRALWASGDHPAVARDLFGALGPALVEACGVHAGQQVLDVAAGAGAAAIPAAATGADVVASDLTPELFHAGRVAAAARGVAPRWTEADAEALPFRDGTFDVVLSCVGAMFAPRHRVVADELVRVVRPGGTIGMVNWTPSGFVGRLLATLRPFVPQLGASPESWGDEEHVRALFGGRVTALTVRRRVVVATRDGDPASFREYWKRHDGATIAAYRAAAADPEQVARLDRAFLDLLADAAREAGPDRTACSAEYLLVTARRAGTGSHLRISGTAHPGPTPSGHRPPGHRDRREARP